VKSRHREVLFKEGTKHREPIPKNLDADFRGSMCVGSLYLKTMKTMILVRGSYEHAYNLMIKREVLFEGERRYDQQLEDQ
jgi:hypothetical protein